MLPRWFEEDELRVMDKPTASPFTMISVGGNFGEVVDDEDGSGDRDGSGGSVGNGSGVLVSERTGDSDEGAAERGEGSGGRVKRRESWRAEGRSGMLGEGIEMQKPGMSRRSVSRQSK